MISGTSLRPFVLLCFLLVLPALSFASEIPRYSLGGEVIHGGIPNLTKAGGDTINLMSTHDDPTNGPGEPFYFGDFEDAAGNPDWNGWTHLDLTQETTSEWQVSNYNQPDSLNHAAWCGSLDFPSCGIDDPEGGYGNSWHMIIEFRQAVADPGSNSLVTITADLIHDTEYGYDYVYLSYKYGVQPFGDIQTWNGAGTVAVNGAVTYLPADYLDGSDIAVYFRFTSDGGYSDEDCAFSSSGACQIDNINVNIVNVNHNTDYFEDFEHGGDSDNFGLWNISLPPGVGDFAQLWQGLPDLDPCVTNHSSQVAFIDDGLVVPGTGGSECINWCYGPGGFIVTTTGGLMGPANHILNQIESPVMEWPDPPAGAGADYDGIIATVGIYRHEDLSIDAPGVIYQWAVRSADTDNSAGNGYQTIENEPWRDRHFAYYGGPDYTRLEQNVTQFMNQGRDEVQVALTVNELGWLWGYVGNDGYPAPYFDNVTVKVFPQVGPALSAREIALAQDNFPERGTIDYGDLGSHSVRFDMAMNISLNATLRNDPGDSIIVRASPVRSGSGLTARPQLHYTMKRNPVFDPYRTSGWPTSGSVTGGWAGDFVTFEFDLPDTGFMFPGDVLHYYISATDAIGGPGGSDPQTVTLPADTTGFSTFFKGPLAYHSSFTVRALPSIQDDGFGGYQQPEILFINDFANHGGQQKWHQSLLYNGYIPQEDYDTYYVNGPSSGVGNGIGGRANHLMLAGYEEILYTCGDLGVNTISNGDFTNDPGNDVQALADWLDQGGKDMFLTGDNLVSDLAQSGSATNDFATRYLGVLLSTFQVRSFIDNQTSPVVRVVQGNPVFFNVDTWVAYGGCPGLTSFDGVQLSGTASRLAEFTDPSGQSGAYTFSAATLNVMNPGPLQSRVISMPVDFMNIQTDHDALPESLPARTLLQQNVLMYFGRVGLTDPSPVNDTPGLAFRTANHPNPFNPATTITYSLPRAGHLQLKVYNLRGQLVKTLIDGDRPAGENQTVVWDGKDDLGSASASGIYFYEARSGGDVKIGKMTLLK